MNNLTRRDFLKLAGLAAGSLAFSPFATDPSPFNDSELVRVTTTAVSVYSKPSDASTITRTWQRDALLNIYEEVTASQPNYNPVWYRVWGGYMHRARLQKVKIRYNPAPAEIVEGRQLGQITVPYTQSLRFLPNGIYRPLFRLYYDTVHWIIGIDEGPDGQPWYRILDELYDSLLYYHVPASHVRLIPPEEYTPLSANVPPEQKRIEVNLQTQTLLAYENDQPVFTTGISTGIPGVYVAPGQIPTATPKGKFNVQVKMPSKHMGNGSLVSDVEAYELPGVAWTIFFTNQGHAFHAAYWHDNFGVPMSRGCVNMRTHEALWLFRWCSPPAAYEEIHPLTLDKKGLGTRIDIF